MKTGWKTQEWLDCSLLSILLNPSLCFLHTLSRDFSPQSNKNSAKHKRCALTSTSGLHHSQTDGHFIREIIRRVNWRQEGKHVGKQGRWSVPFPCRIVATWQKTATSECKGLHYTQAILSYKAGAVGQNKYPGPSLCSQKSCKNGDCGVWNNRSIGPSLGIERQNQYNWKTNVSISTAEDIQKLSWYHRIFIMKTWKIVMLWCYLPAVIPSWEPTWENTFIAINRIAYCMSIYQGLFPSGTYSQSKKITITAHQIGCDSCFTTLPFHKLFIRRTGCERPQ